MVIPDNIKINGIYYDIKRQKMNDCGNFDAKQKLIIIANDLPEDIEELTFWHEVLHAANQEYDEEKTEQIAQQITQIRRDNLLYEKINDPIEL